MLRHPSALSKQLREQCAAEKRVERARELTQVAQYRRFLRVLMHSSPAYLEDEDFIAALRALHPQREPVASLLSSSLPTATTTSRKLMRRVLRKMVDHSAAGPDGMPVLHLRR